MGALPLARDRRPAPAVALALALTLSATTAAAQDDTGAPLLEPVTVTARKREEALERVPLAVTAIDEAELAAYGVDDLAELDALVPNLTIYAARGASSTVTAYIRGVGQSDPLWGADPGVGIYLDDVYLARAQAALLDLLDVERIEVLRGPQGTLYGKNTIGGAIRYLTRPLAPDPEGRAELVAGDFDRLDVKAVVNAPLGSDALVGRLAVGALNRDGFGTNRTNGAPVSDKEVLVARGALGFRPADSVDVAVSADWLDDQSGVRGGQRLNAFNPFDPDRTPPFDDRYDSASGMPNVNDVAMSGASATVQWRPAGAWSLKSVTAWRQGDTETTIDFDQLPDAIADVRGTLDDEQLTQEFQLNLDGARGDGVFGLYWFDGTAGGTVYNAFLGTTFTGLSGDIDTRSLAAYGEGTWRFADDFALTLGARWTQERKRATVLNRAFRDATFDADAVLATQAAFEDSVEVDDVSPRIALDWRASEAWLLYASATRGFKSGGFNIRANVAAVPASARPFEDESVTSYELGAKAAWRDGRVRTGIAAFHQDYRDIQLSVFSAYDSNGDGVDDAFFGDFTNAARGTIDGLEVELSARIGERWLLQGQYAWLDARYDEYVDRGVDVADTKAFTNAPPRSGMVSLEYAWPFARGELAARVSYARQSKVYPTTDLSEDIAQGSYGLLDAGLAWNSPARAWTVTLQGTNVTDTAYRTSGYNVPVLGVLAGFYGPPRQVALGVRRVW
jgi:iron complex outermembrane recepter protein